MQTRLLIGPWSHGMFQNVVGDARLRPARDGRLARHGRRSRHDARSTWFKRSSRDDPARRRRPPRVSCSCRASTAGATKTTGRCARARPPTGTCGSGGGSRPRRLRTDDGDDSFVLRPARPVPDARRRSGEAARLRAGPTGPGADPRPPRRARLHVGRPRARPRGDRPGDRAAVRDHERRVHRLRRQAVRRARRRPHVQRLRRHRAHAPTTASARGPSTCGRPSIVFLRGHRIRVLVSSSDFPRYERNPNTGENPWEATVFEPVAPARVPRRRARVRASCCRSCA